VLHLRVHPAVQSLSFLLQEGPGEAFHTSICDPVNQWLGRKVRQRLGLEERQWLGDAAGQCMGARGV
jgi:hypothetical protein